MLNKFFTSSADKNKPLPNAVASGVVINVPDDNTINFPWPEIADALISASGNGGSDNKTGDANVEEDDYDNSVQQCGGRLRDVFIWTAQQFFGRIVREAATDVWKFFRGCCSELMNMEDEE